MNVGVSTAWKETLQAVRKSDRAESVSDVYTQHKCRFYIVCLDGQMSNM